MVKWKIGKINRNNNAQNDFKQFGSFIEKYVLDGELDKIYLQKEFSLKILYHFEKLYN